MPRHVGYELVLFRQGSEDWLLVRQGWDTAPLGVSNAASEKRRLQAVGFTLAIIAEVGGGEPEGFDIEHGHLDLDVAAELGVRRGQRLARVLKLLQIVRRLLIVALYQKS